MVVHLDILFDPSVAVTITVLFPTLAAVNEDILREIDGLPQLSAEAATTFDAVMVAVPLAFSNTVSVLQVTVG